MKCLITSVSAIINPYTRHPFAGIEDTLDRFIRMQPGNEVVVISAMGNYLDLIPERFQPMKIKQAYRRSNLITSLIKQNPGLTRSSVIILGSSDADFFLAANEKVLLLSANYSPKTHEKVRQYGIAISSPQKLISFFDHYLNIDNPWYYRLQVDEKTTILALTNANTFTLSQDQVEMNNQFKLHLKQGHGRYKELFLNYFIMSVYSSDLVEEFRKVDFWSIYPSSSEEINNELHSFMEAIRHMFKAKPFAEPGGTNKSRLIFERLRRTTKRHHLQKDERIRRGCIDQFETIRINPYYRKTAFRNKTICIIDDYTTYGTSCETSRHILEYLGAKRIIFIALGKYGKEYLKYQYAIKESAREGFDYAELSYPPYKQKNDFLLNDRANKAFIESLSDLL